MDNKISMTYEEKDEQFDVVIQRGQEAIETWEDCPTRPKGLTKQPNRVRVNHAGRPEILGGGLQWVTKRMPSIPGGGGGGDYERLRVTGLQNHEGKARLQKGDLAIPTTTD